ncbi:MAG: energy transducer TonB [Gammaproteobacteria bacterium]|nr:energy transducer TonB [Gammaproteobacteria bacterium]
MQAVTFDYEPRSPVVTANDRMAFTMCIAVLVHAMIVLGVSFVPEPPARMRAEGLEVILVTQKSEQAPEDPDMLAQVSAQGGGSADGAARPATPLLAPLPSVTPTLAASAVTPQTASSTQQALPLEPLTVSPVPQTTTQAAPTPSAAPARLVKSAIIAKLPDPAPSTTRATADAKPAPNPAEAPSPVLTSPAALPTAAQLITRSFAMASLHAELQQKLQVKAKRPRMKFVSATTQEYKYAAYMEAWRVKVERIGNLNYPDEARKKKLAGSLLLDVSLKPDGSVLEIIVRRSSGHRVLDDAAVRIVELAGPYAPFPDDIRSEVDVLHVTRTWKFLNSEKFQAQ